MSIRPSLASHHSSATTPPVELHPLPASNITLIEESPLLKEAGFSGGAPSNGYQSVLPSRISKRLLVIHILHGVLLLISASTLIVSFGRWEHRIPVDIQRVSQVTSYITLSVQIFFTGAIMLLYALSSHVAIDATIRRPRTLLDLDFRLQAWFGGIGPSITNGLLRRDRYRHISKVVVLGIPLYFIAGEVLKVTSSSVVGVHIYNSTTWVSSAAQNHLTPFKSEYLVHRDQELVDCSLEGELGDYFHIRDMWQTARETMRLKPDNDTTRPGLIGNTLYDVIDTTMPYTLARSNATKMTVQCSLLNRDDLNHTFDLSDDEFSVSETSYVRWSGDFFPFFHTTLPASSRPKYRNFTEATTDMLLDFQLWADYRYMEIQSWPVENITSESVYFGNGVSSDVLFVLIANTTELLVHDSINSVGDLKDLTLITPASECVDICDEEDIDRESAECVDYFLSQEGCIAGSETFYFQPIGCTLHTSESKIYLNSAGALDEANYNATQPSPPHEWTDFSWTDPATNDDFLSREFLEMLVEPACLVDGVSEQRKPELWLTVLLKLLYETKDLNVLENTLANLTASYLWNVWQECDSPLHYLWGYQQCVGRTDPEYLADRSTEAGFMQIATLAQLEFVQWKAVITTLCSMILLALSLILLGTRTYDGSPRAWTFSETALLLKDSSIPNLVANASDGMYVQAPIRYVVGDRARLDVTWDTSNSQWR